MIKDLLLLQSGLISPLKFRQDEITRRLFNLELNSHKDVASVHTGAVNFLDVDKSENRYLLSGCSDGGVYIHDLLEYSNAVSDGQHHYTAKCVCIVKKQSGVGHSSSVECTTWFGRDNELFITSGTDLSLKVWDANSMRPVESFRCKGRIFHHDCTPVPSLHPILAAANLCCVDNLKIKINNISVASSVKHIELIDLRTGSSIHELRGHNNSVMACSWSPANENMLATGGMDNKILFWDIRSSRSCLKSLDQYNGKSTTGTAHSGCVNGLKFTDDGLLLLSMGTDNRVRLWETFKGNHQMINYGKIKNNVKRHLEFAISSNSKPPLAYVPSEGFVYVIDIYTGKTVRVLHGHFSLVNCSYCRQPNQELYTGGKDRNLLIWTPDSSQCHTHNKYVRNSSRLPLVRTLDNWSSDED